MTFCFGWLVIFHAVKQCAFDETKGWAIECDPNEYLIAKGVRMQCICVSYYVNMVCKYEPQKVLDNMLWLLLQCCFYFILFFFFSQILYAFTLPLLIVDYIIWNGLFVPLFWKQHTAKIFDIWYEFHICDCSKWSKMPLTKYYDANANHKIEGKKHKHTQKIPKIKYWLENANINIKVKYKAVVFIFICTCIGLVFFLLFPLRFVDTRNHISLRASFLA